MASDDHGSCPNCKADLNGGSIWETGFDFAMTDGHDTWPHVRAKSVEEAEKRADKYAAAYGATRTKGRWGRAIGWEYDKDRIEEWECPDCKHRWGR